MRRLLSETLFVITSPEGHRSETIASTAVSAVCKILAKRNFYTLEENKMKKDIQEISPGQVLIRRTGRIYKTEERG